MKTNLSMFAVAASLAWAAPSAADVGPDVMTIDEAAIWLRVPTGELEVLAIRGDLPARLVGDKDWRLSRHALNEWLARRTADERKNVVPTTGSPESSSSSEPMLGRTAASSTNVVRRTSTPTADETAMRDVSVVGKAGSYSLGLDLDYAYGDAGSRGFSTLGARAESDTTSSTLSARYMLNDRTQFFANLPYQNRRFKIEDPVSGEVERTSQRGLQLFGIGARRVLTSEAEGVPQVVVGFEALIPLAAEARKSLALELSASKSIDPVSVYSSLRIERILGRYDGLSGNRLALGLGYVYALNDNLAASTSLNMRVEDAEDNLGSGWRQTKSFDLKLGLSVNLAKSGLYLEPHVAFGLNQSNSLTRLGLSVVKYFNE